MATLTDHNGINPEPAAERNGARSPTLHHGYRCWRHLHLYWCRLFYWLHRFNDHDSVCLRCYAYHHLPAKECQHDRRLAAANHLGRPHD